MDIRQLRTFVTVARLASVTKAAEALHITQPAVSGQLRSLEEELGLSLLARTTTSVALTQCGQELLGKAEKAIEAFGDFAHSAKGFRGLIAGRLRIGIVMLDPDMLRIGPLLHEMVSAHPALKIDLQVGRVSWLHDALRSSEIDAAILVCRQCPEGMRALRLKPLTFRLVAPASWQQRLEGASLEDIAQMPWIRMTQRSAHQEMMEEILTKAGIKPLQTVEADHESLIRALVVAGVGIGLVREDLAAQARASGEVVFLGEHQATTHLALLYPEGRGSDPALRALLAALRKLWTLDVEDATILP